MGNNNTKKERYHKMTWVKKYIVDPVVNANNYVAEKAAEPSRKYIVDPVVNTTNYVAEKTAEKTAEPRRKLNTFFATEKIQGWNNSAHQLYQTTRAQAGSFAIDADEVRK